MESRIERFLSDWQHVAGDLLDALGDCPAVHRPSPQSAENQPVKSTLQEIETGQLTVPRRRPHPRLTGKGAALPLLRGSWSSQTAGGMPEGGVRPRPEPSVPAFARKGKPGKDPGSSSLTPANLSRRPPHDFVGFRPTAEEAVCPKLSATGFPSRVHRTISCQWKRTDEWAHHRVCGLLLLTEGSGMYT
jgi:hypothetical protein